MVVRKQTLKVASVIAGTGLCISLYVIWNHHRKDKLATLLLDELNKLLNPSTAGLAGEVAFDLKYADQMIEKVKGIVLIKADAAERYAKEINSAWGIIYDDVNKVYSVFRNLKDKVQVSQVAKAYDSNFKINLIDELKSRLNDKELIPVLNIIRSIPPYRVIKKV